MKKLFILLLGCFSATVVAILAFINNVSVVIRWWDMFIESGGDTALMEQEVSGIIPLLDCTAVDYSAVTTFIPMLGLIFMTRALFVMMRKKRVRGEDFPFFPGSDQVNVALGLFGTLWGIIVIGYFKLETVAMADLMQCLHTALFSTLMAVVWVFLIDRPLVRPYFKRLLAINDLAETDDGEIDETIKKFIVRLGKAADSFEARQTEFEKRFMDRQNACEKSFRDQLANFEKAIRDRQNAFEEAAKNREKAFQDALNKCIATISESLAKQIETVAIASESRQKELSNAFATTIASLNDQIAKSDVATAKRIATYEEEFEARQKEYVEVFRRRIDELQASKNEAIAHAEASDARLDAITKALRA